MKTPAQIQDWLNQNLHKFDLPEQWLGTEPNSAHRPWDTATARWCLIASWPYEAAAGNQSIPAVYKAIHDHADHFLCDRTYLPTTPGDLRLLEKNNVPMFGIESKHELADFDVIGSSISYPVLTMSFIKLLTMSGIPARWKERDPNDSPMVIAGGLSYGAPEVLAPVVDCWFLGEVEDEPGNPGIGAVTQTIAGFKQSGRWGNDRVACYADLARQFNFLYFPRFVDIHYTYEDRTHVGVGPHPSKQVAGYTSNLDGMRLPLRKRHVKDLDAIKPLDNPPLLYADPAMGSGDVEVARSCIAEEEFVFLPGRGLCRIGDLSVEGNHPFNLFSASQGNKSAFRVAHVLDNGLKDTVRVMTDKGFAVRCTPDHPIRTVRGWVAPEDLTASDRVFIYYGQGAAGPDAALDAAAADINFETDYRHDPLKRAAGMSRVGNRARTFFVPKNLTPALSWLLGFMVGDGGLERDGKSVFFMVHTSEPEVETHVREAMSQIFGLSQPSVKLRPGVPVKYLYYYSAPLVRWLCQNFGFSCGKATPETKLFVPVPVRTSSIEVQQAFVAGLLEADAAVNDRAIVLTSVSERLAREVAMVLLNCGVPCSISSRVAKAGKKIGGVYWSVRLIKAVDASRSWVDFVSHRKSQVSAPFRSNEVGQGSKFHKLDAGYIESRVTSVAPAGLARVLDLHVPEVESFDCAGLNVHNCPAWCSFCSLSWKSKPYRQRSIPYVMDYAKNLQDNMGSTRMAPFSPDLPMYTQRKELVAGLLENVSDEIDAASMRVDDFIADNTFILLQVQGGLDAVSLGVEGNSQRMRDLIGKGTSDNEIKQAVAQGITAGIRKFKLFMISNLPGEDEGDIYRILKLAKDLADIRESMNQPTVRIQFSWTPLIVEANTPMQWFAPQPQSRVLGDVWEEFRDLKIEFKLGSKVEENKIAFFQLCQRASRDVGEAIVDAILDANQACWGGVPRTFKAVLEQKLHDHGFDNGYADCFDERFLTDMFGWEMIDTGVNVELMWRAYVQMRDLAEQTDSHTYDLNFDESYGGSEWILRCNDRCYGRACGACDYGDLKHRQRYLQTQDRDINLTDLRPVDQTSQATRIRLRIDRSEKVRFVGNDHWRFALRRAFFQAQTKLNMTFGIAKRSIKFASDEIKHRDWVHGIDYAELAFTRPLDDDQIAHMITWANHYLHGQVTIGDWKRHPVDAVGIRTDTASFLYRLEIDEEYDHVADRLRWWTATTDIPVRLAVQGGYFAPASELVNAKDYVEQLWLRPDGHRLHLNLHLRPRPTPYNITAALLGKPSWFPYAKHAAHRIECFVTSNPDQQDFFRPNCQHCGRQIPVNILDNAYAHDICPPCTDRQENPLVLVAN